MSEQTTNHAKRAAASDEPRPSDDPPYGPILKAPVTPVQALNREQLFDALWAMIRKDQVPKEAAT
jgi:hypothetical protein